MDLLHSIFVYAAVPLDICYSLVPADPFIQVPPVYSTHTAELPCDRSICERTALALVRAGGPGLAPYGAIVCA